MIRHARLECGICNQPHLPERLYYTDLNGRKLTQPICDQCHELVVRQSVLQIRANDTLSATTATEQRKPMAKRK
jgi:hypothetical protein